MTKLHVFRIGVVDLPSKSNVAPAALITFADNWDALDIDLDLPPHEIGKPLMMMQQMQQQQGEGKRASVARGGADEKADEKADKLLMAESDLDIFNLNGADINLLSPGRQAAQQILEDFGFNVNDLPLNDDLMMQDDVLMGEQQEEKRKDMSMEVARAGPEAGNDAFVADLSGVGGAAADEVALPAANADITQQQLELDLADASQAKKRGKKRQLVVQIDDRIEIPLVRDENVHTTRRPNISYSRASVSREHGFSLVPTFAASKDSPFHVLFAGVQAKAAAAPAVSGVDQARADHERDEIPLDGNDVVADLPLDQLGDAGLDITGLPLIDGESPSKRGRQEDEFPAPSSEAIAPEEKAKNAEEEEKEHLQRAENMRLLLVSKMRNKDAITSEKDLLPQKKTSPAMAAKTFYELLVLKSHSVIDVSQKVSFGDIQISKGPKFNQPFSSTISSMARPVA